MQCNIDSRGKAVRLTGGLAMIAAAGILVVLLLLGALRGWPWWAAAGGMLALGAFGVFEARAGWCALRAMGIRTRV